MPRLLVIDTETGGLDALTHSILTLGAVVWDNGELVDTFEIVIAEPSIVADPDALKVNRINLKDVRKDGISPESSVQRIDAFLNEYFKPDERVPLVGHNVGFDIDFLRRLYRLGNGDYEKRFSHRTVDTAGIIRFLIVAGLIDLDSGSSSAAFKYFGVSIEDQDRHTALGDAIATATLFTRLVRSVDSKRGEFRVRP